MRCHCPPDSFIGYLRRRSLCTISRIAAPFAQCVPRLIGLSQEGSWPVQTPFCTSAVTVQPTEQWVQMFLRMTVGVVFGCGDGMPAPRVTELAESTPSVPNPTLVIPDRLRKVRRVRP